MEKNRILLSLAHMGGTEQKWVNEAFKILSEATGKPINWLKSQLNAETFANGVGKRKEFIENLVGKTDDKLALLGDDYFKGMEFYKPHNLDDISSGREIAEKVFDDIANRNFNVFSDDAITRALNTADNQYKYNLQDFVLYCLIVCNELFAHLNF